MVPDVQKAYQREIFLEAILIILPLRTGEILRYRTSHYIRMNKSEKKGFCIDIEDATKENKCFRKVLYTGEYSQVVLMTLKKGDEIGMEVHDDRDQFFRFEEGEGEVIINDNVYKVKDGSAVVVPAGAMHNVVNTGNEKLKLYTIYSPAEHKDKTVHGTKADAEVHEEHFDGETTE